MENTVQQMLIERRVQLLDQLMKHFPQGEPQFKQLMDIDLALRAIGGNTVAPPAPARSTAPSLAAVRTASDAAEQVIREAGAPMSLVDITAAMMDRGWGGDMADRPRAIRTAITTHMKGHKSIRHYEAKFADIDGKIGLIEWAKK